MIKTRDNKVYVSFDIGADTTKSAYAYVDQSGAYHHHLAFNADGIPSIAYYNVEKGNWIFDSAEINSMTKASFRYIVKIKELLNLFHQKENGFYDKHRKFKNFYYPPRESESYAETIANDRYFEANLTPKQVCQAFVNHCIGRLKAEIAAQFGRSITIVYVVVYPAFAKLDYIEELRSFVKKASGAEEGNIIVFSSPKSVGVAAKEFDILGSAKNVLIFNVGEDEISVVKARFDDRNILIYGSEGHCPPRPIGGRNVDLYLSEWLTLRSDAIRPFGSQGEAQQGENGSYYDQYCMQQEIKMGKSFFSNGVSYQRLGNKVTFTVYREMLTDISLTQKEFVTCCEGVFQRVWEYIEEELGKKENPDVDTIILAGGAADTYGLDKYICKQLAASKYKKIRYLDFSPENEAQGYDDILCESKNTVPIGAALFGAGKYAFSIVTTRSYGTYNYSPKHNVHYYSEMVQKGTVIPISGKVIEQECEAAPVAVRMQTKHEGKWLIYNEYYKCDLTPNDFILDDAKVKFIGYHPVQGKHDPNDATDHFQGSYGSRTTMGEVRITFDIIGFYKLVFIVPEGINYAQYHLSSENNLFAEIDGICAGMVEGFKIDSEGRAIPFARCGRLVKGKLDNAAPYGLIRTELVPNGMKEGMNIND